MIKLISSIGLGLNAQTQSCTGNNSKLTARDAKLWAKVHPSECVREGKMHLRSRLGMTLVTLALLTGGCAGGASHLPTIAESAPYEYRLAPGDELRVFVPGLMGPDVPSNTTYVVNDSGDISLPVLGAVPANGKTVPELEKSVAQMLVSAQILKGPVVSIQPTRLRPFYITGEVKNPGEYLYRPGMSVLAAISAAGGYTYRADQKAVAITRGTGGQVSTVKATEAARLQPGDTIRVFERWF